MTYDDLLGKIPKNWGRWGSGDEIGCLNYLGQKEVLRAIKSVIQGKVFPLAVEICSDSGDPVWPNKSGAVKFMIKDKASFLSKKSKPYSGEMEGADDFISMYLHGTTHFDALGHVWYEDRLWNGYDSITTIDGLEKADILPIAEHGVVGSAVLLDIANMMGKKSLDRGEAFGLDEILACAKKQGIEITKHDVLLIRTGWLNVFYEKGPHAFYDNEFSEPGLSFSTDLVNWMHKMEIPVLGTDSLANETTYDPKTKLFLPLHLALLRNLGVLMNEILWLEDLAKDCSKDGQYRFMYVAAPLKIKGASGAPTNPIVIK